MRNEIWKDIIGYDGIYEISNLGRVKSLPREVRVGKNGFRTLTERILKNSLNNTGYYRVNLKLENKGICFLVHRLVGVAFIPNPENKRTINHKNGIKTDNIEPNLEWNTDLENINHCKKVLGIRHNKRRVKNIITGKVYDSLNDSLLDCDYSKSYMSEMLNGNYPNKTPYIFIE